MKRDQIKILSVDNFTIEPDAQERYRAKHGVGIEEAGRQVGVEFIVGEPDVADDDDAAADPALVPLAPLVGLTSVEKLDKAAVTFLQSLCGYVADDEGEWPAEQEVEMPWGERQLWQWTKRQLHVTRAKITYHPGESEPMVPIH